MDGLMERMTNTCPRTYRKVIGSKWRTRITQILFSNKPLFFVKIDTSGLDPLRDRMIGIVISKNHFEDDKLIRDDEFATLVIPEDGFKVPEKASRINHITSEMIDEQGMYHQNVMEQVVEFLGKDANISGYNTKDFIGPFLENEARRAGIKLSIGYTFDMLHMAKALLPSTESNLYPSYYRTAKMLGIDPENGMRGYIDVFNKLYARMPVGIEKAKVKKDEYWEESSTCRYIYLYTDCGKVALNCHTGCFEEIVPGSFNSIDLDALTDYILEKRKVNSICEFIRLYDKRSKYVA